MAHRRAIIVLSVEGDDSFVSSALARYAGVVYNRKGTIKRLFVAVLEDRQSWRDTLLALLRSK